MTNNQLYLQEAIENLNFGKLNEYESQFVENIKDYNKKKLRELTYKQYKFLVQCAEK